MRSSVGIFHAHGIWRLILKPTEDGDPQSLSNIVPLIATCGESSKAAQECLGRKPGTRHWTKFALCAGRKHLTFSVNERTTDELFPVDLLKAFRLRQGLTNNVMLTVAAPYNAASPLNVIAWKLLAAQSYNCAQGLENKPLQLNPAP